MDSNLEYVNEDKTGGKIDRERYDRSHPYNCKKCDARLLKYDTGPIDVFCPDCDVRVFHY